MRASKAMTPTFPGYRGVFEAFSASDVRSNHAQIERRNAVHRRFGYDPDAGVQFVLERTLPLTGRVLDVGTGKGRFAIPLARHVTEVVTLDVSAEEQRTARMEAVHANLAHRIRFVVHDARALPWPAASFDAVVSWNVVHHLDDPERVFDEMLRVLKPGGTLALADFSPSGFRIMDAVHQAEGRRHPHPPSHFTHWRLLLKQRGFRVRHSLGHHQELLVARKPSMTDRLSLVSGLVLQPARRVID